jgi:hypothetical protein
MSRFSRCAALTLLVVALVPSLAEARVKHKHHTAALPANAHNSASDMDIRKQCYQEAQLRWSSTSQDVQTSRDFAYQTCAYSHGVRNP